MKIITKTNISVLLIGASLCSIVCVCVLRSEVPTTRAWGGFKDEIRAQKLKSRKNSTLISESARMSLALPVDVKAGPDSLTSVKAMP